MAPLDSNSHKHSSMQIIQSLEERIYCEVDRRLSQVAQSSCEISFLGDIQNTLSHSPGQLALSGPV